MPVAKTIIWTMLSLLFLIIFMAILWFLFTRITYAPGPILENESPLANEEPSPLVPVATASPSPSLSPIESDSDLEAELLILEQTDIDQLETIIEQNNKDSSQF